MSRARHWSYRGELRRKDVLRRDDYRCQIQLEGCLGTATEVDHIIRREWGGSDQANNLRAACKWCNNHLNNPRQRNRFLGSGGYRRAPIQNISPVGRWSAIRSDYSRKDPDDGDSAA